MNDWQPYLDDLLKRRTPDGGFAGQPGGRHRPDAAAWAVLALRAWTALPEPGPVLDRLAQGQLRDGRVPIDPDYPQAFWPTSETIFAWDGSASHAANQSRAVDFLFAHHRRPLSSEQGRRRGTRHDHSRLAVDREDAFVG